MLVFCSFLIWCFTGLLLRYFLNYFQIFPLAPNITGITSVFTFHMCSIPTVKPAYFRILSVSFLIRFLSPEIGTFTYIHVHLNFYGLCCLVYNQEWLYRFAIMLSGL